MDFPPLPTTVDEINVRQWETFAPYYKALQTRDLNATTVRNWLIDWSQITNVLSEAIGLSYIEKALNTADTEKEQAFLDIINNVIPQSRIAEQNLKERLLAYKGAGNGHTNEALGLGDDIELVLKAMRAEADLFREENVPLQTELAKLSNEYDKITGGLATKWQGETKNLAQLNQLLTSKDRTTRRTAWETIHTLWLSQRDSINTLYEQMVKHRHQLAINAGLPDFRAYAFCELQRFDYTPEDCLTFHDAIETVVVPAANRIRAKKAAQLGLTALRPWDEAVDTNDAPPLRPYQDQSELIQGSLRMFQQLDHELANYLQIMDKEALLDLDTRTGKALGGFCNTLKLRKRPFIFMNGVGTHDNVQTLLHEAGHAFHAFEALHHPLTWQIEAPMEFCEVASMSMELLAAPYLTKANGGFYSPSEAARARIEHLEGIILFWPYMAVVDAFQHWAYTHPQAAQNAQNCDAKWHELWNRFIPNVVWNGWESTKITGWHRKEHIFSVPFYYIEYGMAQVGALQIWRNSLSNPDDAVRAYRQALALGNTKPLPALFAAAGAEFRFDTAILNELVTLIEKTINELEATI